MIFPTKARWLANPEGAAPDDAGGLTGKRRRHSACWLALSIYACCLVAFIADITSINTLAFGVFYVPLVATAAFYEDKGAVWVLASIACVMVVIGTFIPSFDPHLPGLVLNRVLSICAVLATAVFVWRARFIRDQLSEQSTRARAAESLASEVLTNLRQEIRAPLHTMFGMLQFVSPPDGQANHNAAPGMVRNAGRRLVMAVDNLVDLMHFKNKSLPAEMIDLGMLLHQTVEAFHPDILAGQIRLTIDTSSGIDAFVHANPWALRRILENQIGYAIVHGKPGGHIVISTSVEYECAVVAITDTDERPRAVIQFANDLNRPSIPSAMGLAFCQRLAAAMNARLVFGDSSTEGSTSRLLLPVPRTRSERVTPV